MRLDYLIASFLIVATLAVYWPVCGYDFVQFDDQIHVYENPYLNPVSFGSVITLWQNPHERLYIPLTWSLWATVAALSGYITGEIPAAKLNPHIFHMVNLVLHILSVLAVFAILRLLVVIHGFGNSGGEPVGRGRAGGNLAAGFGALLFALHPLQVQAVAWVTGMKDILSGLLSLVAIWQYITYVIAISWTGCEPGAGRRAHLHYVVAFIAFVLAVLSKPVAAATVLAAWVIDYCVLRRSARASAAALAGWLAVAVPIVLLTQIEQPATSIVFIPPLWARFLVAGDAVTFYLYKLVLPLRLGIDYGRTPQFALQRGWIYFAWIVPCWLAVLISFIKDRRSWLAPLGIFIAGILPVSGLIPGVFQDLSTVQDHYLYFSMLGPALALAWFISRSRGPLTAIICVILLGLLGIRSVSQTWTWQNSITLFDHALEVNPDSWFVHTSLGTTFAQQGKLDEAVAQYREAIRIQPGFSLAHYDLGLVLAKQGKFEEAIAHYSEALRITPDFPKARKHLRRAIRETGKTEDQSPEIENR